MTRFIFGRSGSGKTTLVRNMILSDLQNGRKVMLLVPEQQAVSEELELCRTSSGVVTADLEVLNFKRLCNRVFRTFGGLSYNYINDGGRALLMWQALLSVAPLLTEYEQAPAMCDKYVPTMLSAVKEFTAYGISPKKLADAAEKIREEDERLARKTADLAAIYGAYRALVHENFDDSEEDIAKLAALLSENDFFSGYNVYIDSFNGFTPAELKVICEILSQAAETTITLAMRKNDTSLPFTRIKDTYRALLPRARDLGLEEISLDKMRRTGHEDLMLLDEYLPDFEGNIADHAFSDVPNRIRCIGCSDVYEEVEFTAKEILKKIRSGARPRDIAVTVADVSAYVGVADVIFERYGIPCHMSVRESICDKPLYKMILCALKIKSGNFACDDVISYVKTGLSGLDEDEADALERYILTWKIYGEKRYTEGDWYMNPDGYTESFSPRAQSILDLANRARQKLVDSLSKLYDNIGSSGDVRGISAALYSFLCENDIPARLAEIEEDHTALWNLLVDSLDMLVLLLGSVRTNAAGYADLLSAVLAQANYGSIPSSADEVTIGSAALLRTDGIKHMFLLGVNDGIFPAAARSEGIFADKEKVILDSHGVSLSPDAEFAATSDMFDFYRVVACASESVTFVYSETDLTGKTQKPSYALMRVKALFPNMRDEKYSDIPLTDKIEGYAASLGYAASGSSNESEALRRIYARDPKYSELLAASKVPVTEGKCSFSPETARKLVPGNINLTQSRLEKYVMCPFSYECEYHLRPDKSRKAEFRATDVGNFVHAILERFFGLVSTPDGIRTDFADGEVERITDELILDYMSGICAKTVASYDELSSNRMTRLVLRLKRNVMLLIDNLIKEFSQSDFIPTFFEMPIGTSGEKNEIPPLDIPLSDGSLVRIYGRVDRVDTYRKGDDVYVRVVDYKTGKKEFSPSDLALGLNLQMLIYLFSIWQDKTGTFKRLAECKGDVVPAGVLYCGAGIPSVGISTETSEEKVLELVSDKLKRSGVLISDVEILTAMEKKLEGKYIPVTLKKGGELKTNMPLETIEDFGRMMSDISAKIAQICELMKSGKSDAEPLKTKTADACRYCDFKPVCRKEQR